MRRTNTLLFTACLAATSVTAQPTEAQPDAATMPAVVERYSADAQSLRRFHDLPADAASRDRLDAFYTEQLTALDAMDYDALSVTDRIDWHLLHTSIRRSQHSLTYDASRQAELDAVLPFADAILTLERDRRDMQPLDADGYRAAAETLDAIHQHAVDALDHAIAANDDADTPPGLTPAQARRAAGLVDSLRRTLDHWHGFYAAFDPQFAWWCEQPHTDAAAALNTLAKRLRENVAGLRGNDDDPLVGDPIGRDELVAQLGFEWLAYSPEELIDRANAELAWCEAELIAAANEMGLGDDWRAALEQVKQAVTDPGTQDDLVAAQAAEAIAFLDEHELVSIPPLCRETWRVEMLSRRAQRNLPFAGYGGQRVLVAAPTADMPHADKLMAARGNNRHFTRNVTPHELIPGHHLQGFVAARVNTHRRIARTPFLVEGWALHWEFVFYDAGWAQGPEDRIGMLFWRAHRAARIVVSLGFHLGEMTPDQMIDYLVDRVGHERSSATSEVRRFIGDGYGPLYQCGYLVGGKQLTDLHHQLVVEGDWTSRAFHDAVLDQNSIPIHFIRAALLDEPLPRDAAADWRFWEPADG